MTKKLRWVEVLVVCALGLGACGGGSSSGGTNDARSVIGGASGGGDPATFHPGALPAPQGSLSVTVPTSATGINGGTSSFDISGSAVIVTVYVSVSGQTGYWSIPVPAGNTLASVLLTFASALGATQDGGSSLQLSIIFEVADGSGNVSPPQAVPTQITVVGTGDVEVALSWDVDNDLDLHVVDPTGNEVFYGNAFDPTSGVQLLDLDSNAGCEIDGINNEHVVWPQGKAPSGTYTVRVDNWQNCTSTAANYTVTVEVKGQATKTFSGSFLATDPGDEGAEGAGVTITTFSF
jgi:hypothetical protein